MVDIDQQVTYWREGAREDWEVACELVDRGRALHGLFFAHLALEKILKAHVCRCTGDLAPRLHNPGPAGRDSRAAPEFSSAADMNAFNIEGRYPGSLLPRPSASEGRGYMTRAEEVFRWLIHQL
jgi:HEPN domain-containing protein